MKIICIGRNYAEHAKEMNAAVPKEPVFFLKPDTALLKDNQPFYYPDFSKEIHHEIELVLKITKNGKNIAPEFAHKYYDEIGIGIDFTARDIQSMCKEKGLPWEKAKAFDHAAPLGGFINKEKLPALENIHFKLLINGKTVQSGSTKDLLFSFDTIISYVSKFITLKTGDLIYTGTPEGVGPVQIGDKLEGFIEEHKLLNFEIK
ncbi:MAG TPA: fumarylacetoacetate hydrolase family protein [Bacteroidia bacterium]|jgi:2-keto-4-pentenoate hydratase/2-oxohepta-3-ene-1,7-dioic acid hydratase in catechol pathway|nr:fumarylacetoacetate hydrolase family protein [Bacteroidia bacterium]HRG52277.1 fumarylacetoacetate hydrolase family protein [Bacteroidia bacterium]